MQTRSYVDDERTLVRLATAQGGFFTSNKLRPLATRPPKRNYHVHAGNWIRERRGIFRLAMHPLPHRPDLVLWWLWSRNRQDEPQDVYSHQAALSLHELTDVMPSKVHLTGPMGFRRSAPIPKAVVVLHLADIPPTEVEPIDGVPVTKALRTLLDVAVAGTVPVEDLRHGFAGAVKTGSITRTEISDAEADLARGELLKLLKRRKADAR